MQAPAIEERVAALYGPQGHGGLQAEPESGALTLRQQEPRRTMDTSDAVTGVEVDELRRSVHAKNNEIALLLHLANDTAQVPISAELSEELSAALARALGEKGQDMETWLQDMADERQRIAQEHQQQVSLIYSSADE